MDSFHKQCCQTVHPHQYPVHQCSGCAWPRLLSFRLQRFGLMRIKKLSYGVKWPRLHLPAFDKCSTKDPWYDWSMEITPRVKHCTTVVVVVVGGLTSQPKANSGGNVMLHLTVRLPFHHTIRGAMFSNACTKFNSI